MSSEENDSNKSIRTVIREELRSISGQLSPISGQVSAVGKRETPPRLSGESLTFIIALAIAAAAVLLSLVSYNALLTIPAAGRCREACEPSRMERFDPNTGVCDCVSAARASADGGVP